MQEQDIEKLHELLAWRTGVDVRIEALSEGVSNFRAFQSEARSMFNDIRDFMTEWRTRSEEQAAQRNREAVRVKEEKDEDFQIVNTGIAEKGALISQKSLVWTIAGVVMCIVGVLVSIFFGALTLYVMRHATLSPIDILHHSRFALAYAVIR